MKSGIISPPWVIWWWNIFSFSFNLYPFFFRLYFQGLWFKDFMKQEILYLTIRYAKSFAPYT